MFRQAEGIEARDRGGGAPPAGFLPRMIKRGVVGGSGDAVIEVLPVEEIPEMGLEDDLVSSDPENPPMEKEFEI